MSVSEALDSVCRDIICSFPSFPKLPCAILISEFTLKISFSQKNQNSHQQVDDFYILTTISEY